MSNTKSLPTLIELLELIDPNKILSREETGKNIAVLSLISAAQHMSNELTAKQQDKTKRILEGKSEDTTKELIEYFDSIKKKTAYLEKVAESTSYWTIDFMLELYSKASPEKRKVVDTKWPDLAEIASKEKE